MRILFSILFLFSVVTHASDFNAEAVEAQVMAEMSMTEAQNGTNPVGAAESSANSHDKNVAAANSKDSETSAFADKKKENLNENEIPLNLQDKRKAQASDSSVFRIILTLSLLGVVGTGAFFFIRKYKVPQALKHQTQIKVIQQHYLGPKKSLAIVRVAGESILIGVTEHNISMIKSLSLLDDELPEVSSGNFQQAMVQEEINHADDLDVAAYPPKRKLSQKDSDLEDEFAISGVKDIVSKKLKNMRTFQ